MLRRIKLLLALAATMTMLMVVAAPAMADRIDNDFDENDVFIEEFDDSIEFDEVFAFIEFDEVIAVELDDCEFFSVDDNEVFLVCEVNFD